VNDSRMTRLFLFFSSCCKYFCDVCSVRFILFRALARFFVAFICHLLPLPFLFIVCDVMDRVRCAIYTTELLCVCFARIHLDFCDCTYFLDCLNDSARDDRRTMCVCSMSWNGEVQRTELCNGVLEIPTSQMVRLSAVGLACLALPREEMFRHFDSDRSVALARFRKHIAPTLSQIP